MNKMVCYRAGKERGAWYELKCLRAVIEGKEARGESATFERGLYKAWLKTPEYAKADKENRGKGIYGTLSLVGNKQGAVAKIKQGVEHLTPNYATII